MKYDKAVSKDVGRLILLHLMAEFMANMILFAPNQAFISNKIINFVKMKRHFNTHIEGIDLKFWHDLIESRGMLIAFNSYESMKMSAFNLV
ncbi:hypothetical protein EEL33_15575 [Muribaculaceae bacterium Isolate-037 (Harlan)]|jgi:hypothetical protein|nr:hypothetical protein EEL33_15575 [Muribaculaceae bacterium Isolate-037 (Harlan)]